MYSNFMNNQTQLKTTLPYLEFHLTEHCNMNCKGCGHFSCLAEPEFADINQHVMDMKRLSELVNFGTIRLLGGEPLLHPEINEFIKVTRKYFPTSQIAIVTNAILLSSMPEVFWKTLAENRIVINITLYKPMLAKKQALVDLLNSHNIRGSITETLQFFSRSAFRGDQDYLNSYENCKYKYCRFLEAGKIATCASPFTMRHFNKRFNMDIHEEDNGVLDIHDPAVDTERLVKHLNTPFKHCRYCKVKEDYFDWDVTQKKMSEWFNLEYSSY